MLSRKELKEKVDALAEAVVEIITYTPEDDPCAEVFDRSHEVVGDCEDVIYTNKAKDIVDSIDSDELAEAEDYLRELGVEFEGLFKYYSQLAYAYLIERVQRRAEEMLEERTEKNT